MRFGTAGVRFVLNETAEFEEVVKFLSSTLGVMNPERCVIGRDGRIGSPLLSTLAASLSLWHGCDVFDLGVSPTPLVAYSSRELDALGFSITSSHNPPNYSGFKVFDGLGLQLPRRLEEEIERAYLDYEPLSYSNGEYRDASFMLDEYEADLLSRLPETGKAFKLLVDPGNGTASDIAPRLFSSLGHKVIAVNSNLSWSFPGRSPEPTEESLRETSELMELTDSDLGVAYDGDADRLVVLEKGGKVVPDRYLSALLLKLTLERRRGKVVLSVNTSKAVEDVARSYGCEVVRARLGKTFRTLHEVGGVFATEPSKVVDAEWGLWEDGLYSSFKLVQYLSSEGLSIREAIEDIPKYEYLQVNLEADGFDLGKVKERARSAFRRFGVVEESELDGFKLEFEDGSWVLFRKSGTEPKVRIYAESKGDKVRELVKVALGVLNG